MDGEYDDATNTLVSLVFTNPTGKAVGVSVLNAATRGKSDFELPANTSAEARISIAAGSRPGLANANMMMRYPA